MDAVQSGYFRSELTGAIVGEFPDWAPREIELVTYGDFQNPDRSSYSVAATFWGYTITQDYVTIGAHGYSRNSTNDYWFYDPQAASSLGSRDHVGDIDLRLQEDVIALFSLVGEQDLAGVSVYYIKGEIPDASAQALLGEMPSVVESDNAQAEIWIGVDDFLIRKIKLQQKGWDKDLEAELETTTVVTYSDYGKEVDIQPPPTGNETIDDDHGNDPGRATEVLVGHTVDGTIDEDYDPDYFYFQAEEGKGYLIQVANGTLDDSRFSLLSTGLRPEAADLATDEPGIREIRWVASTSGPYFILVESRSSFSSGTYVLSLTEIDPLLVPFDHPSSEDAAAPLEVGGRVEGRGNYESDIDMFTFIAEEGGAYHIELTPRESTQIGFWVYQQGETADQENTTETMDGGAASLQFVASSSGRHFIAVFANADTLAYTLTIVQIDPGEVSIDHGDDYLSATRLAVGESVEGTVDHEEDLDYFSFLAEEGEVYWIDLTPGMNAQVGFSIHDLHYTEVHTGTVGTRWPAPRTGEYFIMVVGVSESGTYTLSITQQPTATPTPRPIPTSVLATGSGKPTIRLADNQYESLWINNAVFEFIAENGYGYPVESIEMTTPIAQASLANGEVDIWIEIWLSYAVIDDWYNEEIANGNIDYLNAPPIFEGVPQFFMVPKWVADEHNIRTIDDMKRPEVVALFPDPEDSSKGVFVNCPIGWQCAEINRAKLQAYGLADLYNIQSGGTGAALDAALAGAQLRNEPVFGYYWAPTALMGLFEWYVIEEPEYTAACWEEVIKGRDDASYTPTEACAYFDNPIGKGINSGLREKAPDIVEMLEKMDMGVAAISKTAAWASDNDIQGDWEKAAIYFLETYEDKWTSWMPQENADKVKEALADMS